MSNEPKFDTSLATNITLVLWLGCGILAVIVTFVAPNHTGLALGLLGISALLFIAYILLVIADVRNWRDKRQK